jgi:hypothetical protein
LGIIIEFAIQASLQHYNSDSSAEVILSSVGITWASS